MYFPTGSAINGAAVVLGGFLGVLLGTRLPGSVKSILYQALSIAIVIMGVKLALGFQSIFLLTLSLVFGGATGAFLKLEKRVEDFGAFVQRKISHGQNPSSSAADAQFSNAFMAGTSIFCVGSMAVLGAVEEGTSGDYSIYLVKSFMDMIVALNIASTLGRGVMLAALPVFVYQGALTLLAVQLQPWLTGGVLVEFTAVGGVLIAGVGAGLLFPEKFNMLNMLPAMIWVCVLFPLFH